jgi:hypothetical protein
MLKNPFSVAPMVQRRLFFGKKQFGWGMRWLCLGVLGVFSGVLGSDFAKTRGFFS